MCNPSSIPGEVDMHQSTSNYPRSNGPRQFWFPWREYALALWEQRTVALVTFALVVTGTMIWTFTRTPIYRATAVLEVDKEDTKLPSIQNAVSADMFDDQYFNTQQKILQSRTLCEQVIDSLSSDQREQISPGAGASADFAGALQESLSVVPVRGSRLIEIHVDHSNPQMAALLANAVAQEFIKKHLEKRMSTSTEAVRWLQQQAEGYQEQVKQGHLPGNLGPAHPQQPGTESDINDLKTKLDPVTNPALIPAIANNPEVATLRQRLKEEQIQMAVLRERYKPQHPAMMALQTELNQTEEKLATACRLLYMEGLMDHAGLAGARIPKTGNLLLNPREMRGTPGRHPGIMTPEDLVVVDPKGKKVEGENNPPSETPIFTGVFRARDDVMAIFHLHLPTATLFVVGHALLTALFVGLAATYLGLLARTLIG